MAVGGKGEFQVWPGLDRVQKKELRIRLTINSGQLIIAVIKPAKSNHRKKDSINKWIILKEPTIEPEQLTRTTKSL